MLSSGVEYLPSMPNAFLFVVMLRNKPRASHVLGKGSVTKPSKILG